MQGTYFRWTRLAEAPDVLKADILGQTSIMADKKTGAVLADLIPQRMDPDEARMIGVRLIEAAVLADDGRSIREP